MPFSVNVPAANKSPGIFPGQNNENFRRLKAIINSDHNFTDSSSVSQGFHRQVSMINRDTPGSLGNADSILFSKLDINGQSQLHFYNGIEDTTLTPIQFIFPIRFVGSQSVGAGASFTFLPDPGYRYCGTGFVMIENTDSYSSYTILRSGSNSLKGLTSNAGGFTQPTLVFSGNNLQIKNNSSVIRTLVWSLVVNRIS